MLLKPGAELSQHSINIQRSMNIIEWECIESAVVFTKREYKWGDPRHRKHTRWMLPQWENTNEMNSNEWEMVKHWNALSATQSRVDRWMSDKWKVIIFYCLARIQPLAVWIKRCFNIYMHFRHSNNLKVIYDAHSRVAVHSIGEKYELWNKSDIEKCASRVYYTEVMIMARALEG